MSANYQSLTDGLVLMATIVFWSLAMNAAAYRWAWAARLMKPKPVLLIEGGRFRRRNMRRELVTEEELRSELRKRGVHDLADVESVQMESDGEISGVPRRPARRARRARIVRTGSAAIGTADGDQSSTTWPGSSGIRRRGLVSLGGSARLGGWVPVVAPAIALAVSESGPGGGTKIAWR